uniref:Protein kinase domain-containing protein n=1 Tax=Aegilops tauschii subsp. strangulata TaxID=200361 RepID=A0A453MFS7_AEGTS
SLKNLVKMASVLFIRGKLEDGKVIAVKRFDERMIKPEEQFERVVDLMRLKHKNIVRLIGYCYEPTKVPVPDEKNPELYIWKDVIENLLCYEFLPNKSPDVILNGMTTKELFFMFHFFIYYFSYYSRQN